MAQPIIINTAPERYRLLAAQARAEGITNAADIAAKVLFQYQQSKEAQQKLKLETMGEIIKDGVGPAMGPGFAQEFEKISGVKLPRNDKGEPIIPGKPVEMKPQPSQVEVDLAREKTKAIEDQHALDRTSREKIAGMSADARKYSADKRAEATSAKAGNEYSGHRVDANGKIISERQFQAYPDRYADSHKLSVDGYNLRLRSKNLAQTNAMQAARFEVLSRTLQHDVHQMPELRGLYNAAVKAKDDKMQRRILSSMIGTVNQKDHLGYTDKELQDLASDPGVNSWFSFAFNRNTPAQSDVTEKPTPAPQSVQQPQNQAQQQDLGDGWTVQMRNN